MKYLLMTLIIIMLSCKSQKRMDVENKEETIEHNTPQEDYIKGELIVLFADKEDYKKTIETLKTYKDVELISILSKMEDAKIAHFKVPVGKEQEYIKIFQKNSNVKVAELNIIGSYN